MQQNIIRDSQVSGQTPDLAFTLRLFATDERQTISVKMQNFIFQEKRVNGELGDVGFRDAEQNQAIGFAATNRRSRFVTTTASTELDSNSRKSLSLARRASRRFGFLENIFPLSVSGSVSAEDVPGLVSKRQGVANWIWRFFRFTITAASRVLGQYLRHFLEGTLSAFREWVQCLPKT